jgi:hypothetical protein
LKVDDKLPTHEFHATHINPSDNAHG